MKLANITAALHAPKPWQLIAGATAAALAVVLVPAITHVYVANQKKQTDEVLNKQAGQPGAVWTPVAFPVGPKPQPQETPPSTMPPPPPWIEKTFGLPHGPPPTNSLAAKDEPKPNLGANSSNKFGTTSTSDPMQDAINAPILVSSSNGQGGGNAPPQQTAQNNMTSERAGTSNSAIGNSLKPTDLPGYSATMIKHPSFTIEQGRMMQCTTVSRATSGMPGFVTAKIKYDQWSFDKTVKLLEQDSTIFGEIDHGLVNGQDRMFVLWRQVTTPSGVRITLNTSATDEMGEAGVPGNLDQHILKKVGGAVMLSGIEAVFSGVSGYLSNLGSNRNGSSQSQGVNLNFSQVGSQGNNLASQLLASTINIPDTLTVNQASHCGFFAAGDLDFSTVYNVKKVAE